MVDETRLSVKNLSVSFINSEGTETEVVKSISFNINENETLAIVGESGSGKTVSALSIIKLLPSKRTKISGTIHFCGKNLTTFPEEEIMRIRGKDIGMIFQEPLTALNPLHTIAKQIGEVVELHNSWMKPAAIRLKIRELLRSVELESLIDRMDSYPHQLSGGQRQRVMIAIAIANNPKLLIADEPTTAIDSRIAKQIMDLLERIKNEYKLSILFITHDLSMVKNYSDRICIMKDGRIIEQGNTKAVFNNPQEEYTKFLINSEPVRLISKTISSNQDALDIKKLSVEVKRNLNILSFGRTNKKILNDISFNVKKGETLGIIGESGSGKTTLAQAILRLIKSTGEIIVDGHTINNLSNRALKPYRRNIQIVFQDPFESLNPRMTVFEIISEGPLAHKKFTIAELEERVKESMLEVGLDTSYINRYPHELSGGQRQRIAIARAIIMRPSLIILDEPTSALDKAVQKTVLNLLRDLQKKLNLSYILISHDLSVIKALSHRVAVIEKGEIKMIGMYEEIIKKIA